MYYTRRADNPDDCRIDLLFFLSQNNSGVALGNCKLCSRLPGGSINMNTSRDKVIDASNAAAFFGRNWILSAVGCGGQEKSMQEDISL